MLVSIVTGTRPQIIKSAPVMQALEHEGINYEFIHTGQHYDYELAQSFISDFNLRKPIDLEVGSGTYTYQLYATIERLASHYEKKTPDYMIVPGDTTSALGAALAGFKIEVPVCHLESGLRRYDLTIHEEMNRRLIDHGSSALFAPTVVAVENLEAENIQGSIYLIGDTMYDILKKRMNIFLNSQFQDEVFSKYNISKGEYAVFTWHRRENVDDRINLEEVVYAIDQLDYPIIFPMHPRTKKTLAEASLEFKNANLTIVPPLPYDEFMCLIGNAGLTISDSGGLQKECYLLGTPLVSLHSRTEWVETLKPGKHLLGGISKSRIVDDCQELFGKRYQSDPSVYGDGNAAGKIPPILLSGDIEIPSDLGSKETYSYF